MPERAVVLLAVCAWVGAVSAIAVPWLIGAVVVGSALALRRPWLLCIGVFVLTGALAAASQAGLEGLPAEPYSGEVTVLSDPDRFGEEVRVDVRLGRRHLEAWASGSAADELARRAAGDRVAVRGRRVPFEVFGGRQLSRHLAGRLDVAIVDSWRPGHWPYRLANSYRRLLDDGARSMDADDRSLLLGLALGDDRGQSAAMVDAFRGAGLTHLLAVSGQNVAFVLLIVGPLLRRLPSVGRITLVVAVLSLFGLITRFEPSVLRATVMAGIAVGSTALGRPAGGRRGLALAVVALLIVDPLLVHSVGFRLSVAASAGIVVAARPIADAVPGPPWFGQPLGVIVAAQLAVAPLLVMTFGPVPLGSLPGNVLAGPAAGPAMIWAMTGGALAGLVPDGSASVLHIPSRVLLGWIALVARLIAAAPLGALGGVGLVLLAVATLLFRSSRTRPPRSLLAVILVVAAVGAPVVSAVASPVPQRQAVEGGSVWRSGDDAVLVVHEVVRPVDLLADLRRARVRGLDLIAPEVALPDDVLGALRERFGPVPVLSDDDVIGPTIAVPSTDGSMSVGSLSVVVRRGGSEPVLDVIPSRVG